MDPATINALVNMGSAGAVILVVVIFLRSNKERETAYRLEQVARDKEWRSFFTTLNSNNKTEVLQLAQTMAAMVKALDEHDDQAKTILEKVNNVAEGVAVLREKAVSGKARTSRAAQ